MEVVILCGGKGTRLMPITEDIPKPLFHIGDKPILWHIMNLYASQGHRDFILLLGYRGEMIKDFFSNPQNVPSDWKITFLDTGIESTKGDRLRMARKAIRGENFLLAYGDDLSDVDINKLIDFHKRNNKLATITSIRLPSNFGVLEINESDEVRAFIEKPLLEQWISGGFIVLNKKIFEHMPEGVDETDAFQVLAPRGLVQAYKHEGFWKTMNTITDANQLNEMWESGELKKKLYPSD